MKTIINAQILMLLLFLYSCDTNRKYHINEKYTFETIPGKEYYLKVSLPTTYGYQTTSDVKVSNVTDYHFEEKDGYRVLYAKIIGNGSSITASIRYSVIIDEKVNSWEGMVKEDYLLPGELIDSDNENIISVAKSLIGEDDYQTAKNISDYVTCNLKSIGHSQVNTIPKRASEILKLKTGVCADYSNLTVAMLRAVGIPAKRISGLSLEKLSSTGPWKSSAFSGSHAWVEFYANSKWHFDDPTWGNSYFDDSDLYHLSYGLKLSDISSKDYEIIQSEINNSGYKIIGAMTAPIDFVAWTDDQNGVITPEVEIKKD